MINQTQDELIEEFGLFDDWADKYEYLIDLGKKLLPMSESFKTEDNVIKGCQSKEIIMERYFKFDQRESNCDLDFS
jgi:cysteine desulfuration protein SufE